MTAVPVPPEREKPYEVPWREVEHQEPDEGGTITTPVGSVTDGWTHDRLITAEERKRWKEEDAERERRRIPLGFRAGRLVCDPESSP